MSDAPEEPSEEWKAEQELRVALEKYLAIFRRSDTSLYMVLNDADTFTSLHGCTIIRCPSNWETEEIERALSGEDDDEMDIIFGFDEGE